MYTGKEEGAEHGLCTQSVITLMEGLEGKGHILYTDNYYSSPTLFKYLYERGIYACGTFRPNRKGVPSGLKVKNLPKMTPVEKGYNKVYSKDEMVACVWKDKKKIVFLLSTFHIPRFGDGSLPTVKRRVGHEKIDVQCPPCLFDYVAYMRGVDRGDQMVALYRNFPHGKKAWRRILYYLIEVCVLNSYVIEKKNR